LKARISKWGNSLAIRLPRQILSELSLSEGDSMEILAENGKLIITPVLKEYGLEELVQGITAENQHTETDWGPPQGAESW
jgi:antitoxin MazE